MKLTAFHTVRARLLALLVAIALPIAVLTAIAAVTTYRTVIATIETSQTRTADDFAVRTTVWYQGILHSLLSTEAGFDGVSAATCRSVGAELLARISGYRGFSIASGAGPACIVALDGAISDAQFGVALAELRQRRTTPFVTGGQEIQVRYDHMALAGRGYLAVYMRTGSLQAPSSEGLLLVDPALLDKIYDFGPGDDGFKVALVARGDRIVTIRGKVDADPSWLPARPADMLWDGKSTAPSRAGEARVYERRMIAEPDFYVLTSFDDKAERAAKVQFLALLLAPLVTLALLCLVYMRAIDQHCVRWLRGIEAAARAKSRSQPAHAPIADDMPTDIRSVAEAFNMMVEEQEVRQRKLQTALDDNKFLVRELHHRVKNSLQVVQSYIGLTKRDYRGEARVALADAECRVHVLSAAYRFTLADGEMQPVRVQPFIEDVVTMITNLIRRRDQWIAGRIVTSASLSVDRIIPLGFLVVDVVARALRHTPRLTVAITVSDVDASTMSILIESDEPIAHSEPPKLFAGLMAQIEAVQVSQPDGIHLGEWHVRHRS